MDQKIRFLVLLAAGLLCLNLIPICWAEDPLEDVLQEDLDVEDELDPGFVGAEEEEELEGDLQDEAPPTPKTPPVPKVRGSRLVDCCCPCPPVCAEPDPFALASRAGPVRSEPGCS